MQIKTPVHVGLVVILAGACALQAESRLSILSAAGGVAAVAPGSFAVGYGPIGAVAVIGQADDHGALPTDLGGYSVLVNGTKAQIQYVGPSQVNFIVPEDSNLGDSAVVIRSANQDVLTGSATIRPLAPAIFTMVQNGREFGAILNAVTFSGGPFDALTSEIQGCDQRTRLAIFATGMGFSMNRVRPRDVRVEAQDANGTVWPLDVEAAVAAPGLPAVEQINVAIPAGLNTGTMVLRVFANGVVSNKVGFDVAPPNPNASAVPSLQLGTCLGNVSIARAAQGFSGSLSMLRAAPAGGLTVQLTGDAGITVPASVQIPEGQSSAQFAIVPGAAVPARFTVTATTASGPRTATFEQGPACVDGIGLAYTGVVSGKSVDGSVALTDPAPAGGVKVTMASTNTGVTVTPLVTVPAGLMSAPFSISTSQTVLSATVAVMATGACGGSVTSLNVVNAPCVAAVNLSAASVTGGATVTGTVVLNAPAQAGGLFVNLGSGNAGVQVDSQLIVPEGATSATFQVKTSAVTVKTLTAITATVTTCGTAGATLTVLPQ